MGRSLKDEPGLAKEKGGIFQRGDPDGPRNGSEDGEVCTFALHSALACVNSLTPHSPILLLRKLRFRAVTALDQGHPALVGLQPQAFQAPGPR